MCMRSNIEGVDRTGKNLMRCNISFAGKAILFLGYFRQILPVVQRGSKALILALCFERSPLSPLLKMLRLTTDMRLLALQQNTDADEEALAFLIFSLDVGNESRPRTEDYRFEFPSSTHKKNTIQNLCDVVFSRLDQTYENTEWLISRAMKTCKNRFFSDINKSVIKSFPEELQDYLSCDTVKNNQEDEHTHPVEFFSNMTVRLTLPDHMLKLKNCVIFDAALKD